MVSCVIVYCMVYSYVWKFIARKDFYSLLFIFSYKIGRDNSFFYSLQNVIHECNFQMWLNNELTYFVLTTIAGPFTLFAPTDDAFRSLPAGTLDSLITNREELKKVLLSHVASGTLYKRGLSSGLVPVIAGGNVKAAVGFSKWKTILNHYSLLTTVVFPFVYQTEPCLAMLRWSRRTFLRLMESFTSLTLSSFIQSVKHQKLFSTNHQKLLTTNQQNLLLINRKQE